MNKTAVALTVGLIISVAAGTFSFSSAELMDYYEAYRPVTTPVEIQFFSPQNNSVTNETSILLVFNVTAQKVVSVTEQASSVDSWLERVYIKGDWQNERQQLYDRESYFHSKNTSANVGPFDFLEFNTTVSNIPEGTHELLVMASGSVGVKVGLMGGSYTSHSNSSIIFTIISLESTQLPTQPTQEPFITTLALATIIIVAIIGVALLVYFKKHKAA